MPGHFKTFLDTSSYALLLGVLLLAGSSSATAQGSVPAPGLRLWLKADVGVTLVSGAVSEWADQSGNGRHASQATAANRPALVGTALNGKPALAFDGANDFLTFTLPVNGLTAMTLVLVSSSAVNADGSGNGVANAPLFWNETGDWGTVHLSPFQSRVKFRFGTRQANNLPEYIRPVSVGANFGRAMAIKNGANERLYVDGQQVLDLSGKLPTISGISDTGNVGRGYNNNTYFAGRIAEVLVYDRALSDAERQQLDEYLNTKYFTTTPPPPDTTAPNISLVRSTPGAAGATITWTTDEPASSQVDYGPTATYNQSTPLDSALVTSHSVTLTGLTGSTEYHFRVKSQDASGNPASSGDNTFVTTATSVFPLTGLRLWLKADQGVTQTSGAVSRWADQSGNGIDASQATAGSQPALVNSAINGKPALAFDGANDFLTFTLPVNGLTAMTLVLVSSNTVNADGSGNGVSNAPLFWNETSGWGTVHLSPFQSRVKFRFGTGQSNNLPHYIRPVPVGANYGRAMAIKNGANERLFVDGQQVLDLGGKLPTLVGISNTGNLGRGYNDNTYFAGRIAEVLVYDRALSDAERQQVDEYLSTKYFTATPPPPDTTAPNISLVRSAPGTNSATITWTTDEPATSQVDYGPTASYNQSSPLSTAMVTSHSVTLSGLASSTEYHFRVKSQDASGNPASSGDNSFVTLAPSPPSAIPLTGLRLWLKADQGVTQASGAVSRWADQSGRGVDATQAAAGSQPALINAAINGRPALAFDGLNDFLTFTLPVNGLTAMTLVLVSANTVNADGTGNGVANAPLFWNETAGWGTVHLSPFQGRVKFRFGTGQVNNLPVYPRAWVGSNFTRAMAIKDGANEKLYLEGLQVLSLTGKLPAIAVTSSTGNLGRGYNDNTYFGGRIAEVLVYDRALSDAERQQVDQYLNTKYFVLTGNQPPTAVNNSHSMTQGGTLTLNAAAGVLANDTDPNMDALQAVLVHNVSNGALSLSANGAFTYTPAPGFYGVDSFTYRARDAALESNLATVRITVNPAGLRNQAPQIVTGAAAFAKLIVGTGVDETHAVAAADFNEDGRLDVAATDYINGKVYWYENTGNGGFIPRVLDANLTGAYPIHAADVDRDGDVDVLAGGYLSHTYVWYENDGRGGFTRRIIDNIASGAHSIVTGDIDRDGDVDLLTANQDGNTIAWYENDGANGFLWRLIDSTSHQAKRAELADMDRDGDIDVVAASFRFGEIAWHQNNGNQTFTKRVIDTTASGAYYVFPADVDGDLDLDLFAASQLNHTIALYRNNGAGAFSKQVIDTNARGARTVIAVDIDRDGDLDAVAASVENDTVAVYRNDGAGNFVKQVVDSGADGAYGVFAIDFDGDSDVDVLSASRDADAIALHSQYKGHVASVRIAGTLLIDTALLRAVDADDGPADLTYTITDAPDFGQLQKSGIVMAVGSTFTQADIDGGAVSYRHNGGNLSADRFSFTVADGGEGGVKPAAGAFTINIVN
jgi:hypothetical protein